MYIQGNLQYNYHVAHYGHPSKIGFMEIDNLWKADKWEPEKLIELYIKAGAKYFVALANHHDNFDNYNSNIMNGIRFSLDPKGILSVPGQKLPARKVYILVSAIIQPMPGTGFRPLTAMTVKVH